MNTAYRSASAVTNLAGFIDAEWLDSPNATLRLLFAAPGFGQLRTVDVLEPYASAIWRAVRPAEEPEPEPTPHTNGHAPHTPARAPHTSRAVAAAPAADPRPKGALGVATSYSPGYRSGNGGSALPTRYPSKPRVEDGPPTRASQLFPWAKKMSERGDVDLVGYLEQWGGGQGFRGRFREWSDREVGLAVREAELFLQEQGVNP